MGKNKEAEKVANRVIEALKREHVERIKPTEIKTIFERLESFKNGYFNHYYTQIVGGGTFLLEDIAKLKAYIGQLEGE